MANRRCSLLSRTIQEGAGLVMNWDRLKAQVAVGQETTRVLVAKIGRASRLGERSRGHLDAGATSCYLILQSIANSITDLLE